MYKFKMQILFSEPRKLAAKRRKKKKRQADKLARADSYIACIELYLMQAHPATLGQFRPNDDFRKCGTALEVPSIHGTLVWH